MARVQIAGDHLRVQLRGMSKVWAMKSRLEIPLTSVRGATIDPDVVREPKGVRSPGLHIPGVAAVGTFHHHGEKTLWETYRGTRTIVIQLTGQSYDRIAVEVPNPREAVELINGSLPRRPAGSR
ncbi:hypothetical protein AB2L28_05425 [Kineococcus sp. TBRC 1896]|uniref:Bacterial Pleckstrin homology domain-containing protein n=1 Tax=Kineococcus mangrovi TaxID=1660183 RepID=A0ABV4HZ30_9ACTN